MRPITVINGIVLGSAFSIAFGLSVVGIIFLIIGTDTEFVADEIGDLGGSIVWFSVLTAVAALSFVASLKRWRWGWAYQLAMWLAVFVVGRAFWPS
ncbi:MAG: hypothetical protein AAGH76_14340 [Pseudomonadota bacterium]